ncbi:hypothetical protein SAMN05444377_10922 [Flavobacterium fontis]|uniref:Uncharacterized protein n=1 Tax=Flavobacterium fontis TaxID=1124188 RepID=A0A1M5BNK5_9FLAO|nr:hypothetical protein SAMN05444377_10922 [Flavobacterium fontis]
MRVIYTFFFLTLIKNEKNTKVGAFIESSFLIVNHAKIFTLDVFFVDFELRTVELEKLGSEKNHFP